MSRSGELYAARYLTGDMALEITQRKLKSVMLKQHICSWLVQRMLYSESQAGSPGVLLANLCAHDSGAVIARMTQMDASVSPKAAQPLHRLFNAQDLAVWLDATKKTKTRTMLHQFTRWPALLEHIPRRQRGQILEEELGL